MPENTNFLGLRTRRLCVQRERPRRGRATEQCDELAPVACDPSESGPLRNPETIAASKPSSERQMVGETGVRKLIRLHGRDGSNPDPPPWGPHVRFRPVQTLVPEGSPLVKLRNSAEGEYRIIR